MAKTGSNHAGPCAEQAERGQRDRMTKNDDARAVVSGVDGPVATACHIPSPHR